MFPQLTTYLAAFKSAKDETINHPHYNWEQSLNRGKGVTTELNVQNLNIAVPQERGTELPAQAESDALRGDTYLGSAASDGVECGEKVFTDSNTERSRKERFKC